MSDILSQIEKIQSNIREIKSTWGSTIMAIDNIKSGLKADRQKAIEAAYQKGIEDMHEAIKKIANMSAEERNAIFGAPTLFYAINEYTANGIIVRVLRTHKEEKKADPEIKVGDEVIATSGKAVVYGVFTGGDKTLGCRYMYSDGSLGWDSATALTKTGRHFPQIAEVLKAMKEVTE